MISEKAQEIFCSTPTAYVQHDFCKFPVILEPKLTWLAVDLEYLSRGALPISKCPGSHSRIWLGLLASTINLIYNFLRAMCKNPARIITCRICQKCSEISKYDFVQFSLRDLCNVQEELSCSSHKTFVIVLFQHLISMPVISIGPKRSIINLCCTACNFANI